MVECDNKYGEAVSPTSSLLISSLSAKHLIEEDTLKQKKNINLKDTHAMGNRYVNFNIC